MSQPHPIQNDVVMFVTTNTFERKNTFQKDIYAREAIETLYRVQPIHPFFLYGFVIMPDHCHFLLCVPPPETISKIMNVYKSGVTFNTGLRRKMWQPRFHMRIPDDPETALRYIHMNPVKANLTEEPEDYKWSSASGLWDTSPLEDWHGKSYYHRNASTKEHIS